MFDTRANVKIPCFIKVKFELQLKESFKSTSKVCEKIRYLFESLTFDSECTGSQSLVDFHLSVDGFTELLGQKLRIQDSKLKFLTKTQISIKISQSGGLRPEIFNHTLLAKNRM